MTDRHRSLEFEDALELAMRSYAAEGLRSFDPEAIGAQAVAHGAQSWWKGQGPTPLFAMPVLRLALLVVLLAAAVGALAVVGAHLLTPTPPIPGDLAVGSRGHIAIVDPSSKFTRVLTPLGASDNFPVWSPDGTRIAFSQTTGRGQLQVMDADGGNLHALVPGMTSAEPVAWSPDGERLAFDGYGYPGGAGPGLYVVRPDGTDLTMLVPDDKGSGISRIAWSPDGSLIAFAAIDDSRPVDGAGGYVYVVDVASRVVTPVSTSHVETFGSIAPLAWRQGAMELLYAQQYIEALNFGHEDVLLAEWVGDGWRERPLITGLQPSDATYPEWLDAGRFAYARDGGLWVAGVDGRQEVRIGDVPSDPSQPSGDEQYPGCVAPDGSALAIPLNVTDAVGDAFVVVPTDGRPVTRIDIPGVACSWQATRP